MRYLSLLSLLFWVLIGSASQLTIKAADASLQKISSETLLARSDVTKLIIRDNPAYKNQSLTYHAIRLCDLLANVKVKLNDKLTFFAADGFASAIPTQQILQCDDKHPVAYLAIQGASQWPALPHGTGTAGPFTVVWETRGQPVPAEYWPWQVVSIDAVASANPNANLPKPNTNDLAVIKGYDLFQANCSSCHTLNGVGPSQLGPDLNQPLNPVEYFKNLTLLKRFIRDPQSVRYFKNDRMPGIKNALTETELDALVHFLIYMSKQR